MTPIAGAYIADTFLGRFWTFTVSSLIYLAVINLNPCLLALHPPLLQRAFFILCLSMRQPIRALACFILCWGQNSGTNDRDPDQQTCQ
jgi:hypothetical protein